MSILEDLYDGNIYPVEKPIKKDGEYQKINKQLTQHIDELLSLLNSEEKLLCEKIEDNFYKASYISEKERFIEGFRIGAQMMWEVMHFNSSNF